MEWPMMRWKTGTECSSLLRKKTRSEATTKTNTIPGKKPTINSPVSPAKNSNLSSLPTNLPEDTPKASKNSDKPRSQAIVILSTAAAKIFPKMILTM